MKKIPKGLQEHRFKNNPVEKQFAKAWREAQENGMTLAHLLDPRDIHGGKPPEPLHREFVVAATVIQWLGSEVGQNFLKQNGFIRISRKKATKTQIKSMREYIKHLADGAANQEEIIALVDFFDEMKTT